MKAMIKLAGVAAFLLAAGAQAAPLYSTAGFSPTASVITFSEVALAAGATVSNQFAGATFATNGPGQFYVGNGGYANADPVSGAYLDSFSGGGTASIYDITFDADVSAAGAYWEFNAPTTAKFTAMNNGVALESFSYSNTSCCSSPDFIGFQGLVFDTIRVSDISDISGVRFYMDKVTFSGGVIPEPSGIALVALAGMALALARRRKSAGQAV